MGIDELRPTRPTTPTCGITRNKKYDKLQKPPAPIYEPASHPGWHKIATTNASSAHRTLRSAPHRQRSAIVASLLRESTQLLERRRAFGPERAHAETRMERLPRPAASPAEPVEALEQHASTGPCRAFGHDRPADRAAAVRDPAQRLLNARPARRAGTACAPGPLTARGKCRTRGRCRLPAAS